MTAFLGMTSLEAITKSNNSKILNQKSLIKNLQSLNKRLGQFVIERKKHQAPLPRESLRVEWFIN
jgi:hypothetical protein